VSIISNYYEEKLNTINKLKNDIKKIDTNNNSFLSNLLNNNEKSNLATKDKLLKIDIDFRSMINDIEIGYFEKQIELKKILNQQTLNIDSTYNNNISDIETNYKTSKVVSVKNKRASYYQTISNLESEYQESLLSQKNAFDIEVKNIEDKYDSEIKNITSEEANIVLENDNSLNLAKSNYEVSRKKLIDRKQSIITGFDNYMNETKKAQNNTILDMDNIFVVVRQNYQDTSKIINSVVTNRQGVLSDSKKVIAKYFKKARVPFEVLKTKVEEKYNALLKEEDIRHNDQLNKYNSEVLEFKELYEETKQEITKASFENISVITAKLSLFKDTQKKQKATYLQSFNDKYKTDLNNPKYSQEKKELSSKFTIMDKQVEKMITSSALLTTKEKRDYQTLIYKNSIKHINEIHLWKSLVNKEEIEYISNKYMLESRKKFELLNIDLCIKTLDNMESRYNDSLNSGSEIELDNLKLINSFSKIALDRESELLSNDLQLQKYIDQYDSDNKSIKFNNEIINLDYKIERLAIEYEYETRRLTTLLSINQNTLTQQKGNCLLIKNASIELINAINNIDIEGTRFKYEYQIENNYRLIKDLEIYQERNQLSFDFAYYIENSKKLKENTVSLLNYDFSMTSELLNKYKALIDNDLNRNNNVVSCMKEYVLSISSLIEYLVSEYQKEISLSNPDTLRTIISLLLQFIDMLIVDVDYFFLKYREVELKHNHESVESGRDSTSIKEKFCSTFFKALISLNEKTIENNNIEIDELKKRYVQLYDQKASLRNNKNTNSIQDSNLTTINQRIKNLENSKAFYESSSANLHKQINVIKETSLKKATHISKKARKDSIQKSYDTAILKTNLLVKEFLIKTRESINSLENVVYVQSEQINILSSIKLANNNLIDNVSKISLKLFTYCKGFFVISKKEIETYLNTLVKEHISQIRFSNSVIGNKEKYLNNNKLINEKIMATDFNILKAKEIINNKKTKEAFNKKTKELKAISNQISLNKNELNNQIQKNNLVLKSNGQQILVNLNNELKNAILKITTNQKIEVQKNNKKIMANNKEITSRNTLSFDKENSIFNKFREDKQTSLEFYQLRKNKNDEIIKNNNLFFLESTTILDQLPNKISENQVSLENEQKAIVVKKIENTNKTLKKELASELSSLKKSYKYKSKKLS
jgi:hypothetical protein